MCEELPPRHKRGQTDRGSGEYGALENSEEQMNRREQRIANIQKRIKAIDRELEKIGPFKPFETARIRKTDKLLDRRDAWEERLAQAELA